MPIHAVVYIPSADLEEAAATCLMYGAETGYQVEGIVVGRWENVVAMALQGLVQVVIIADRSHLPADRVPRIEIPSEMTGKLCRPAIAEGPPSPSPMRRRPRPLD